MAIAQVFGKICQSRLQKLLPAQYILLTTANSREGTFSPWPTSRHRMHRCNTNPNSLLFAKIEIKRRRQ
jgi:hypothetical protein